jgi:hypothetical protein
MAGMRRELTQRPSADVVGKAETLATQHEGVFPVILPAMPTKDIRAALAAQGVRVRLGLIYVIKSEMKRKKRRQLRRKVASVTRGVGGGPDGAALSPVELIRRVRGLASEVGGFDKLRELVDVLEG